MFATRVRQREEGRDAADVPDIFIGEAVCAQRAEIVVLDLFASSLGTG